MPPLRELLFSRFVSARLPAMKVVAGLPPYQVALWPDGWELEGDGSVTVRDTHAMAEARRWYALAARNRCREDACRVMALHGVFVPRAIVDLAERRFACERIASVAVKLVAGDWVQQRRRQLLADPVAALQERSLGWSGSRHPRRLVGDDVKDVLGGLIDLCAAEGLIPPARYRIDVRADDGYGVAGFRCRIEVRLERYARARVGEVLSTALIPWNRAVVRNGAPVPLIGLLL
jgi:hypothetical protein